MKIHPVLVLSGQLDSRRSPISLDLVADAVEDRECLIERGVCDIECQVEIAMQPRLSTDKSMDTLAAGHPCLVTFGVKYLQHTKNLRSCQTSCHLNPFARLL